MEFNLERRAWIGLNLTLPPRQIMLLLAHFPSAAAAWAASRSALGEVAGFRRVDEFVTRRAAVDVAREVAELRRLGLETFTLADDAYPPPLRDLAYPPPVLYARGRYLEQDQLAMAVVGTRRMSAYGRRAAERLSGDLATRGLTIVSGLALGVDTAAHCQALKAGGRTLAVLGAGFAHMYPPENRALADRIAESGAVFSEFPIHTEPARWTFPRRNRIISGLSRGVLVVEAPLKSGAIITAKAALEQGKEVFAVPGQITHPNTHGCHRLIQQGAKLTTCVEDVLEELPGVRAALPGSPLRPKASSEGLSKAQILVLSALEFDPRHLNAVSESAGLPVATASAALVELELLGLVAQAEPNHYIKLAGDDLGPG